MTRSESPRPGEVIAGGMGGGTVAEDLLLHEECVALGMAERVKRMLHDGRRLKVTVSGNSRLV